MFATIDNILDTIQCHGSFCCGLRYDGTISNCLQQSFINKALLFHLPAMLVDRMILRVHPSGLGLNAIICASGGSAAYNTQIKTPFTIIKVPESIDVPMPLMFCTVSVLLLLLLSASSDSESSRYFFNRDARSSISS